jgi:hypothetical protein
MPNMPHGDTVVGSTFLNCLSGADLSKLDFQLANLDST